MGRNKVNWNVIAKSVVDLPKAEISFAVNVSASMMDYGRMTGMKPDLQANDAGIQGRQCSELP
jgi:hypothetical protein